MCGLGFAFSLIRAFGLARPSRKAANATNSEQKRLRHQRPLKNMAWGLAFYVESSNPKPRRFSALGAQSVPTACAFIANSAQITNVCMNIKFGCEVVRGLGFRPFTPKLRTPSHTGFSVSVPVFSKVHFILR